MKTYTKSKVIWCMLAIGGILSSAEALAGDNIFSTEGASWSTRAVILDPAIPAPDTETVFRLSGQSEINGRNALELWQSDTSSPADASRLIYISADSDKVYFLNEESNEWLLMYDFSLQPGEYTTVWKYNGNALPTSTPNSGVAYCLSVEPDNDNPDIAKMHMAFFESVESMEAESGKYAGEGTWFSGIGGAGGPLGNLEFYSGGGAMVLTKAEIDNRTIYLASGTSGIAAPIEASFIKTGKGTLEIDSSDSACIHDLAGRRYAGNDNRFRNLPRGVYIVTVAGKSCKAYVD